MTIPQNSWTNLQEKESNLFLRLQEALDLAEKIRENCSSKEKIELTEMIDWIQKEKNGYTHHVPEYRRVSGRGFFIYNEEDKVHITEGIMNQYLSVT